MELRIASLEELPQVYETFLRPAFPDAERLPLAGMTALTKKGKYIPLLAVEDGEIVGTCFLRPGMPCFALLDYLCVDAQGRNQGRGGEILRLLQENYPGWTIFGETELPASASDPDLAERRRQFYLRNHCRQADYQAEEFGVRYLVMYWSDEILDEGNLALQHRFVYENQMGPEKFKRYMKIPCPPDAPAGPKVPWR
jgi:hypothetical protein